MNDSVEGLAKLLPAFTTIDDAARLARCHPATARRAFDRGTLAGVRSPELGRLVLRSSAEAWARARMSRGRAA